MKSILVFAGSNSKNSINKKLAIYASEKIFNADVTVLDLNDFELPIYSIDYENELGIPELAKKFLNYIKASDGIVLSLAEHNGAYTSVFKNLFDWMSRIEKKLWNDVPMLLMATSPGKRGGATVLDIAKSSFPHMGGNIVSEFSLPSFYDNFSEKSIKDKEIDQSLNETVAAFESAL